MKSTLALLAFTMMIAAHEQSKLPFHFHNALRFPGETVNITCSGAYATEDPKSGEPDSLTEDVMQILFGVETGTPVSESWSWALPTPVPGKDADGNDVSYGYYRVTLNASYV